MEEKKTDITIPCLQALIQAAQEQGLKVESTPDGRSEGVRRDYVIDVIEFFYQILANIKYVVLASLLCAVLAGVYGAYFTKPMYAATAKLYMLNSNESAIDLSDLQIGTYLTRDYQEVFKTWEVHEMVREDLGIDKSYAKLQSMLTVTNPDDTRILYITVKSQDAKEATDIANAYARAAKQFILDTMDSREPNIFSVALIPGSSLSPRLSYYIILGLVVGAVLVICIIFLKLLFDNRPKTPEGILKYTGLPTLGVIPMIQHMDESTTKRSR